MNIFFFVTSAVPHVGINQMILFVSVEVRECIESLEETEIAGHGFPLFDRAPPIREAEAGSFVLYLGRLADVIVKFWTESVGQVHGVCACVCIDHYLQVVLSIVCMQKSDAGCC